VTRGATLLLPTLPILAPFDSEQLAAKAVSVVGANGVRAGRLGDWRGQSVRLWLDAADVLLVCRPLPALSARRLRQSLPAAIEDAVAGDVAALHCTAGPTLPDGRRWIGAVERAAIESLLDGLAKLDIRVERLSTPIAARLGGSDAAAYAWADPADPGAVRWAAIVDGQALGGDRGLAEALAVMLPAVPTLPAAENVVWNLGEGLVQARLSRPAGQLAMPRWLRALPRFAALLLIPLAIHVVGLGAETMRWALEKRRLAAAPEHVFNELFPGQPVVMDARLLLRLQLDLLESAANPSAGGRGLLPLLGAAGELRRQLPGQPLPVTAEYANGRLTLRFAEAPAARPLTAAGQPVRWDENGREAVIGVEGA
jgi:general secretion pathway protein L